MEINQMIKFLRIRHKINMGWLILSLLVTGLMYYWQQRIFTGWVLIPLIWCIVLLNNTLILYSQNKKLRRLDDWSIEPMFWQQMQVQYPGIGIKQRRLIEQGFKDYLALHLMRKQAYAMPSNAVDALWHVMLGYPEQYRTICKTLLGRELHHRPYTDTQNTDEQFRQLMQTWQQSCQLHGFQPATTQILPRLFAIDQILNWQGGQVYDQGILHQDYRQYLQDQSSSSGGSSCGGDSGCSSCGGD